MTRSRPRITLASAAASAGAVVLAAAIATPAAHADPLDAIRGAVNGARAESTCPPLTYSGQLEAAAQQLARQPSDAYEHINPHGYQGATSGNLVRDDPTARATSELVAQERIPIHDCANKDYGVGMFRDDGADKSVVAVVLGKPAPPKAPPAPPPSPKAAPDPPPAPVHQLAKVVGGDADVFNIAHNDVPDPTTGVVAVKIGKLTNGSQVSIEPPCKNGWCWVDSTQIKRGYGFVEQSHLQLS